MNEFQRISQLPPYTFKIVTEVLIEARHGGEDIIHPGMGNPDIPTPKHMVARLIEAARNGVARDSRIQ